VTLPFFWVRPARRVARKRHPIKHSDTIKQYLQITEGLLLSILS
jgi:hypothetical protein